MANREILALTLTAAGPSVTGNDMENTSCRSAIVYIDQTANSGGTAIYTLEGKDPTSGGYYTILASAAQTGVTNVQMRVDSSITASANLIAQDMVPRTWRVKYTRGTTAITTATVTVLLVA